MSCGRLSGRLPLAYVYLLLSRGETPLVYSGMTARPLKRRLAEHNDPAGLGYTARRGPWSLLAARGYLSRECALIAERRLKRSRYDKQNWLGRLARPGGRLVALCRRHGVEHPLVGGSSDP